MRWTEFQRELGWQTPLEHLPLRTAIPFIHDTLMRMAEDDTARLKINALLGFKEAKVEMERRRQGAIHQLDFETG